MNIIKASKELDKVEQYLLTLNRNMISVKDIEDDTKIDYVAFCLYEDVNSRDEDVEILTILTPDKEVYCTQSATFKKSFMDMWEMMNGAPFTLIKVSGTTKAGRPYVDCILDVTSIK